MTHSPFPGMDPWLEQLWSDVHARLLVYMSDQINDQLPSDLQARVDESLTVDAEDYARTVYPDVSIVENPDQSGAGSAVQPDSVVAEPCIVTLLDDRRPERHIKIVDRNSGNRVVTAIELLSPANKCSAAGRDAYRRKQHEYLQSGVNLVEIDRIRQGEFIVAIPEELVPND